MNILYATISISLYFIIVLIDIQKCQSQSNIYNNDENKVHFVMETFDQNNEIKERYQLYYNYTTYHFNDYNYYYNL